MATTIDLTPGTTRWAFVFSGLVNTAIGIRQLASTDPLISWISLLSLLLVITGPLMLIYGLVLFSRGNKLVPKVRIDDDGIVIREDVHRAQRQIDWNKVKEISYKPFELNFLLTDDQTETIILSTSGEISMDVKKTIRRFADKKQIRVVGG